MSDIRQSSELSLALDAFEPGYSETTTPARGEVADQIDYPRSGQVDESGSFKESSSASEHVDNDKVLDADTDRSGDMKADSDAVSPDHRPVINQSSLPDVRETKDTTMEMESSQTLEKLSMVIIYQMLASPTTLKVSLGVRLTAKSAVTVRSHVN